MAGNEEIISYRGVLNFETIGILLSELKFKKITYHIHQAIYKKIITLMIESLENIFKYSENFREFVNQNPEHNPSFVLSRSDCCYEIEINNPLKKTDRSSLSSKLDKINTLDYKGIKHEYRKTITNGQFTEKGGAGLGFLEMAKVTRNKLKYNIEKINSEFDCFRLTLTLNYHKTSKS